MVIKSILTSLTLVLSVSIMVGQVFDVNASLSGANEVPAVTTTASGTLTGTYDQSTGTINVTVTYSNLGSGLTAGHLHAGAAGSNGGVIVNLAPPTGATSGTFSGSFPVMSSDEMGLLDGNVYINLHTPGNPGGELRGQLALTPSAAVPTMGEWGIICLSISMMIFGVVRLRSKDFVFG